MALQHGSQLNTVQPSLHKDPPILPLIAAHVSPIWPSDKRLDTSKARRRNFHRLVKNRMILVKFLRTLNPAVKVEFLPDIGAKETEDASNIAVLTKRFLDERKKKLERVQQIQMEAFLRGEKSKTVWNNIQEYRYGWESKTDGGGKESLGSAMADELNKELNRKWFKKAEADIFHMKKTQLASIHPLELKSAKIHPVGYERPFSRRMKEIKKTLNDKNDNIRFLSMFSHRSDATPYNCRKPTDDPRFQRLISVLVPPLKGGSRTEKSQENREGQTRRTTKIHLADKERAKTCE